MTNPHRLMRRVRRLQQRGVVLLMSLVILVVLLGAAAALIRSFDTSLSIAGNLSFKRDLVNQAESAVPALMTALSTGELSTYAARGGNLQARNYSATALPTNAQGVPTALLLSDANFDALGFATVNNDLRPNGVRIRYVVDRQCSAEGDERTVISGCATLAGTGTAFDNSDTARVEAQAGGGKSAIPQQVLYRLSLRVDGPRDTQAFMQAVFTR